MVSMYFEWSVQVYLCLVIDRTKRVWNIICSYQALD